MTTGMSNRPELTVELFDVLANASGDSFQSNLETAGRWLAGKSIEEIETVVKHLVGSVIATPLASVYNADAKCVIALESVFYAIPMLEMFNGEESLNILAAWVNDCFPSGTQEAALNSFLSFNELYETALAYNPEGSEDGLKFKNWFLIVSLLDILSEVYRFHFEPV